MYNSLQLENYWLENNKDYLLPADGWHTSSFYKYSLQNKMKSLSCTDS